MTSYTDWFNEKLSKLSNDNARISALQEMKDLFSTASNEEVWRTASSLQLSAIFDCLNDSNNEQVDLACDILTLCMTNLNLGESTSKYGIFLERALNHPHSAVKMMALNEIKRNIKSEDILLDLCKKESLLKNVIKCLADDDLLVVTTTSDILKYIGLSCAGIKQCENIEILKLFYSMMDISELVRFRIYEVFVYISCQSESNFRVLINTQIFSSILNELDNEDILLRLNVLELLSDFGLTNYGFEYLESNHILEKIISLLKSDDLVSLQLCEPGILKFLGNVSLGKPLEFLSKYSLFYTRLCDNLDSDNFTIVGVSIDVLGLVGSTTSGKLALSSNQHWIENAIRKLAQLCRSLPTDLKVRVLNCFENLLCVTDFDNEIMNITKEWYTLIDDSPMNFIWNYLKNPFTEFRFGSLKILRAIAPQCWGQEAIRDFPGLIEFLLDRNVESVKECKEMKYEVVYILSRSSLFDHMTMEKLQAFVKEGPFYVKAITEVATVRDD